MSLERIAEGLRAASFDGKITTKEALARFTTYRLGGPAAVYVEPAGQGDVAALAAAVAGSEEPPPVLVVGRGSNLVISDAGWPGIAIRLGVTFSFVEGSPHGLTAGASTPLPLLANWAARRGLAGLEFTIAIPGSVGGAVRMNAGAHGTEIADRVHTVTVCELSTGELSARPAAAFGFSYRHSNLTDSALVLDATFGLSEDLPGVVRERMESYRRHRAATQPGAVQNAGSVFRNPPGDHAGRLVEATGLKGFRVGGARVSELHANFFIAGAGATAQDVYDLVGEVTRRVADEHGVTLLPEIRFVGAFRDHAGEVRNHG